MSSDELLREMQRTNDPRLIGELLRRGQLADLTLGREIVLQGGHPLGRLWPNIFRLISMRMRPGMVFRLRPQPRAPWVDPLSEAQAVADRICAEADSRLDRRRS